MSPKDPDRLATGDESNAALRELLDAGKRELPTEAQLASLAAKLGPLAGSGNGGGDGGGGNGGGGGGDGGGGGSVLASLGGAKPVAIIVVASLAVWGGQQLFQPSPRSVHNVRPAVSAPLARVVAEEPAVSAAPSDEVPEPLPLAVPAAPVVVKASPSPKPSASVAPPPTPVLPPVQDSDLEVKLLQRAQDALLTTPTDALSLANEDIRRFPNGLLRQEADVLAIDALVHLGRRDAAEARAAKFREAHPGSTHLRRIEAILGREVAR